MHPDHVPDPRPARKSTSGEAPAPREVDDTPDNDDSGRDLSGFLPPEGLVS
jgi:hypothetical protein